MTTQKDRLYNRSVMRKKKERIEQIIQSNRTLSISSLMRMTGTNFMHVFNNLMDAKIDELKEICKENFGDAGVIPQINVRYSLDEEGTLGVAYLKKNLILLDESLIKEYKEYYIKHTFVHEYAHLVVEKLYPGHVKNGRDIDCHGEDFRSVCRLFGIYGDSHVNMSRLSSYPIDKKLVPGS